MKRIFAVAVGWVCFSSGAIAADVGVSIQFSQPGVFGRVDIGQYPQPQVIVPQPVVIEAPPPAMPPPEALYLWVPLEHRKHWERYCHQYHACGHPVYFVNHVWYKNNVLARQGHPQGHQEDRHGGHGQSEEEHGHRKDHDEQDHEHGRGRD
jgi:hypothetical protein